MYRDERRQMSIDFSMTPELVRRYVQHSPRESALRTARQVTGVTHYLSKMAVGEARIAEGSWYGVAIVCMDEVTDELGEELADGKTRDALEGDVTAEPLGILPVARDVARSPQWPDAVEGIAEWQDASLEQLEDPGRQRIWEITRNKGGFSALANLCMVKDCVSEREAEFMYEFGFLMQLLDDYRDRPEDEIAGVSTLFSEGHWDAGDLSEFIEHVQRRAREVWGPSDASKRFFRICRLHRRFGQMTNRTPLDPNHVVPWYL